MKHRIKRIFLPLIFTLSANLLIAQNAKDSVLANASLTECIHYALIHQPLLKQASIDEEIAEHTIKSKLADWYPQVNFDYTYQNNFRLPVSSFQGNISKIGTYNSSLAGFNATQNIFNRDVLLASRSKGDVRLSVRQQTVNQKIDVVVAVTKAFYSVLLTRKQLDVLDDDIQRLQKNLDNAFYQYQGGLVDKTDYKRATITLNNSKAERRRNQELLKARYAYLKQIMGYPFAQELPLSYDSAAMEQQIQLDTTQQVTAENRIEFQLLQTQKKLQIDELKYNKWSFIPSVSANAAYNLNYLNDRLPKLYNAVFPNSYLGLQLNFPIFQGGKRIQQIKISELQVNRIDWSIAALRDSINSQYTQALAVYKGNLANYLVLKENRALAREVYEVIQLQYKQGIKTYLDVIIAESDLRTAELNYSNSLFEVLSSKVDVERALGTVSTN